MKISDSKEFGKCLKERRKELGYTQAYISEVMGLSVSFISDLENGKKTVELEKAIRYANMLGTDMILESRG
ncbi:MAG: helix-turn-helix domain-containing protein [Lachnospiraceae bacterium]|nr:helix-turn-helix domain-containing protein [Lachnospiraceae bacterium]